MTYKIKMTTLIVICTAVLLIAAFLFYSSGGNSSAGGAQSNVEQDLGSATSEPLEAEEAEENKEQNSP